MDRYPAKPILLAVLGLLGCILFLLVGLGAAGLGFYTIHVVQGVGPLTAGVLAGCFCAALFCFALTYFTGRAVIHRLKEANAEAVARRNMLGY
ncbi:MAG TPA: hypothetical protein VL263_23725 [Vicinamibacterales bacterium]|nr:hypothetical protein [Vicinamibacterales bacterium]